MANSLQWRRIEGKPKIIRHDLHPSNLSLDRWRYPTQHDRKPHQWRRIARRWTKWELSQTLLEYQILGLTNDPEQSRILKFLDKFSGKGWVSAREVDRWWSARTKPPANELREFMSKVVKLGQAIDNDEAIESSKYRIQISSNGSDSSDKNSVNVAEKQTRLSLTLVTNSEIEALKLLQNGGSEFVTTDRANGSDKIGDRAKLGDDIITIEKITDDFIGGTSDSGSYVGGSIDSCRIVSDEIPPTPQGEIERVPIGDGFVEIVRQETTIEAGEIEYEC